MGESDLEVRDLHFSYGSVRALQGVDFTAIGGETTSIIGANGAGKSTLLKVVAGLLKAPTGSIAYRGAPAVQSMPAYRRVRQLGIALVPEGRGIFARMSVDDNLALAESVSRKGARSHGSVTRDEILELFPVLGDRRLQLAGLLSGGEQQMLALARVLLMNPTCLLLDEPSMGLAPRLVESIFQSLSGYRRTREMTVVLVEQNTEVALDVSSYAYVLERGQVILEGRPKDVSQSAELRQAYLGL